MDIIRRLRLLGQSSSLGKASCKSIGEEAAAEIERLTAENERLRNRNAALVESLRAHRCLVDGRATVGECQQCGCIDGLLISGDNQQQAVSPKADD